MDTFVTKIVLDRGIQSKVVLSRCIDGALVIYAKNASRSLIPFFFLPVMTSYLQKAGTKLFEKNLEQYRPEDPLYEFYTDKRGKQRRRKVL